MARRSPPRIETLPSELRSRIYEKTGRSGLREVSKFFRDDPRADCEYYTRELYTTETPEVCSLESKGVFHKMLAFAEKFYQDGDIGGLIGSGVTYNGIFEPNVSYEKLEFDNTFYPGEHSTMITIYDWDNSAFSGVWDQLFAYTPATIIYRGETKTTAFVTMHELESLFELLEVDSTFKIYSTDRHNTGPIDASGYVILERYMTHNQMNMVGGLENLAPGANRSR